ncbi:RING-H2 finger protein ATL13 [Cryptomeria japonica]|uniref:RING-H2 finger protein ATL13 n=1 Tax=Cryptomeria japonica TaxID=3369 RepID=UPI0025AC5FDB|nr:RING-H2 finger protein ATL13 [Cryptomeria japonica]
MVGSELMNGRRRASYVMAQPSILVGKAPWNSLKHFGFSLRRAVVQLQKFKTAVTLILILYAFCVGVGYIICMLLLFVDVVAGNRYLYSVVEFTGEAHEFVLSSLQFINGALGMFVGFSILTHSSPRDFFLRIKGNCLCRWRIRGLPKVKYGCLVEEENREKCCVCLEEIGGEESVRILPKCKHYLHGRCIDQWLLCQSNCPICRAPVCQES